MSNTLDGAAVWRTRFARGLETTGRVATLMLPVFLVHFRGVAEALLDVLGGAFLLRSIQTGQWAWTRCAFVLPAFAWWGWIVVCSIPHIHALTPEAIGAFIQAIVAIRFPLAAFALAFWTLRNPSTRSWLRRIIVVSVAYIGAQLLLQAVSGHNLFGNPRFVDGSLTGPYDKPRAAAPFSRLALPVALWLGAWLLIHARAGFLRRVAFTAILLPVVVLLILAGQRMPFAAFLLGIAVATVILPQLRLQALAVLALSPAIAAATAVIAPRAFEHLVRKTASQLGDFAASHYGLIYNRALLMIGAHPWRGLGYDAFRHHCRDEAFLRAGAFASAADGGGSEICVQHVHNHWLEAATNGGLPGLLLFTLMIAGWLWALAIPLKRSAMLRSDLTERAWQAGLFAAFFVQEWPFSSSSAFLNMPLGGVAFLLLGIGLRYGAAAAIPETTLRDPRMNDFLHAVTASTALRTWKTSSRHILAAWRTPGPPASASAARRKPCASPNGTARPTP